METSHSPRLCDFCGESTALLYCKADSAKLCFACDLKVHSANNLFNKHTRWLLCDSCNSTPATIFCFTDATVFCQNCDWESHSSNRSLPAVHDRRPLEGFTGCPSVIELLGILGFDDLGKKQLFFGDDDVAADDSGGGAGVEDYLIGHDSEFINGLSEFLAWEPPSSVINLDDIVLSKSSPAHQFQAMHVPSLPKNRNATCGQHKEEILSQLREMSMLEPDFDWDVKPLIGHQPLFSEEFNQLEQKENSAKLAYEVGGLHWSDSSHKAEDCGISSSFAVSSLVRDKDLDGGDNVVLVNGSCDEQFVPCVPNEPSFQMLPQVPIRELNSKERDCAISRYKEKKKTRRYDKHIRYESRKVRAASRTRIKGRFAKMVD